MANLRPWHEGGHAIVNAAFAVDFAPRPSEQTIRELLALHAKLKTAYPRKRETKGLMIGIPEAELDQAQLNVDVRKPGLFGFELDSLRSDGGVERSITLAGNKLSITRTDYESWEVTWGEVREVFAAREDSTTNRAREKTRLTMPRCKRAARSNP